MARVLIEYGPQATSDLRSRAVSELVQAYAETDDLATHELICRTVDRIGRRFKMSQDFLTNGPGTKMSPN